MNTSPTVESQLDDWLSYLQAQHPNDIELGLDRVKQAASVCGVDTVNKSKVVLVAGTNGKGTTIRFMEQALISKGHSVGVYSSPHVFDYKERVRVNDSLLTDQVHIDAFSYINHHRNNIPLTYFEFGTLAAFKIFQQLELDFLLIEVGLGGRLDATNILNHDLAIITLIDLDHIDWLGNTRELIGFEKAGIFSENKPAIVGDQNIPESVFQQAKERHVSKLICSGSDFSTDFDEKTGLWSYKSYNLVFDKLTASLLPIQNIATAICALTELNIRLSADELNSLISKFELFGRMQIVCSQPVALVDVAHNPNSVNYLATQLRQHPKFEAYKTVIAVVAMMADKNIEDTLRAIENKVDYWFIADLQDNPRAASSNEIEKVLKRIGATRIEKFSTINQAWTQAKAIQNEDSLLVGFGSFFTVAEIIESEQLSEQEVR